MGIDWEETVRCRRRRYGSVLTRIAIPEEDCGSNMDQ